MAGEGRDTVPSREFLSVCLGSFWHPHPKGKKKNR